MKGIIYDPMTLRPILSLSVGALREIVFSPDGKYLLGVKAAPNFEHGFSTILLFILPMFEVVSIAHDMSYAKLTRPDFSPNSKYVVVGRYDTGGVYVLSVPDLAEIRYFDTMQKDLIRCECISDQWFIPVYLDVAGLSVWGFKTGGVVKKLEIDSSMCQCVAKSPDGSKFICACDESFVFLVDAKTLDVISQVDHGSYIFSAVFINNSQLALGLECEPMVIVDCINGRSVRPFGAEQEYLMEVAYCPARGEKIISFQKKLVLI